MVILVNISLQFIATLLATLIGVYSAFTLDRWRQEKHRRERATDHLRSLKAEIRLDISRLKANSRLIKHLQEREQKGNTTY